ncbi:MAG: hypothetical protein QM756_02915 [Polyangiaceae bacterium]
MGYFLGEAFFTTPMPLMTCQIPCGVSAYGADGVYSVDALPAGTCTEASQPCLLDAHRSFGCGGGESPVATHACKCVDGTWDCIAVGVGPAPLGSDCSAPLARACAGIDQLVLTDLVVAAPPDSSVHYPGEPLTITATITNQGVSDVLNFPGLGAGFVLLDDPATVRYFPDRNGVARLAPGESVRLSIVGEVPLDAPQGAHAAIRVSPRSLLTTACTGAGQDFELDIYDNKNLAGCPPTASEAAGACDVPNSTLCVYWNGSQCTTPRCRCAESQWMCFMYLC